MDRWHEKLRFTLTVVWYEKDSIIISEGHSTKQEAKNKPGINHP